MIRNTPEPCRFLIINDPSPDPGIPSYLDSLSARDNRIEVLHNDVNLGFVGTVNRGLGLATGHVVLLNSDALVPEGWLARLMAPILADESVASVTPMSNDAEIFTAPVECKPRQLVTGEADAADRVAARLDWRVASANVPTGVGFCMAIARDWLDKTGGLDPIFGRSYGEEVDWCRRAIARGGRNIAIASLFVEHRSGSFFGAKKADRIRENGRIVSSRYPNFDLSVDQWRKADPLVGPRLAIGLAILDHGTAFPVYLAHRLGGGAEHWLTDQLAEDIRVHNGALVLRDDPDSGRIMTELHSEQGVTCGLLAPDDVVELLAVPGKIRLTYSCLVAAHDPLASIRRCAMALRAHDELQFIFHDFLPLCPSYCLISSAGSYCGLPAANACQSCYEKLPQTPGVRPASIAAWREGWKSLIDRAHDVTVFSVNSQSQLCKVWPDLAPKIQVKPHAPGHLPAPLRPKARSASGRITVGVLGGIGRQKGAALLQDLAKRGDGEIRLVVIGEIDPAYAHPGITVHGRYKRDDIHLLATTYGIDVWLIPSIWPETYCYTAHECLATGLPTFSFDIGAQADALKAAPNGHVLPLGQALGRASFAAADGPAHT